MKKEEDELPCPCCGEAATSRVLGRVEKRTPAPSPWQVFAKQKSMKGMRIGYSIGIVYKEKNIKGK